MSKYFQFFPRTRYKFGDEVSSVAVQNLTVYVNAFEKLKELVTSYNYVTILDGERPDTLSYRIYDTTDYHWTFFYMNDHLRQSGWPLQYQTAVEHAKIFYPHRAVRTKDPLHVAGDHIFTVGQQVTGKSSLTTGTIVRRDIDLGQLIIDTESDNNFNVGERLAYTGPDNIEYEIIVWAEDNEYNGIHHVENSAGEWVDIDPSLQSFGTNKIVTFEEYFVQTNESNKRIIIIDPITIQGVVNSFRRALQ